MNPAQKFKWVWSTYVDQRLSDGDRVVATALALRRHNVLTGRCDPGYTDIAEITGRTRRSAMRSVQKLVTTGYIGVEKGGRSRSNNYVLLPQVVTQESPLEAEEVVTPESLPKQQVVTPESPSTPKSSDARVTKVVTPESPKHTVNPKGVNIVCDTAGVAPGFADARPGAPSPVGLTQLLDIWRGLADLATGWEQKFLAQKLDEPEARAAFDTALASGVEPATVLAGARAYAGCVRRSPAARANRGT